MLGRIPAVSWGLEPGSWTLALAPRSLTRVVTPHVYTGYRWGQLLRGLWPSLPSLVLPGRLSTGSCLFYDLRALRSAHVPLWFLKKISEITEKASQIYPLSRISPPFWLAWGLQARSGSLGNDMSPFRVGFGSRASRAMGRGRLTGFRVRLRSRKVTASLLGDE